MTKEGEDPRATLDANTSESSKCEVSKEAKKRMKRDKEKPAKKSKPNARSDGDSGPMDAEKDKPPSTAAKKEADEIQALETAYQEALRAFKADKTDKDLRRAKSAAKKARDERILATAGPDAEPLICRNCSQLFLFRDRDKFADRGWEKPNQCKRCTYSVDMVRGHDRSHRDRKQNMCYEHQKSGTCSRGDRCKFSHAQDHVGKKKLVQIQTRPLCRSIERGEICPHGDRCRFRHEKE